MWGRSGEVRVSAVREGELKDVQFDISVLSVPEKISGADEIVMGTHGVILKQGARTGVFLPSVAKETGWTREKFLAELCSQKANLPSDCWKDPSVSLYVFTTQEFAESTG